MKSQKNDSNSKLDPHFSWSDLARAYWYLLGPRKWKYLGYQIGLFCILLYQNVPYLVVGTVVDFFTNYKEGQPLTLFYVYTIGLGVSFAVASFIRLSLKRVISKYQTEIMYWTKVRGFEKLLDFSLSWHYQETSGAKAQRIQNGIQAFKTLSTRIQNEVMLATTTFVGVIAVFLFLRATYIALFVFYEIGFFCVLRYFYRRIQHENDQYYLSLEQAGGTYVEGLSNIVTIKTLGVGTDFKSHVAKKEELIKEHENRIIELSNNLWKTFQAFNGICYGLFLFIAGRDIIAHVITPGALVVFYGYVHNLVKNTADVLKVYEDILNAKSGIGRMMGILWAPQIVASGKKQFPLSWSAVKLQNVSFTYRTGLESAVANVSCRISRNARIGIVGKTGSGKSTFAKLLAGLFPISSGEYRIGDTSFYDLSREEQIHHITLVLQETEIFNLSFQDNITLMRNVDPGVLERAISFAQLTDVVAQLPDGLETLVGEKGYHLSGGERQRVGIARAICRDSEILILDEATSSLDTKTEKAIQRALETQLSEKTLIMIAHRISTLENVDTIFVFDGGKIVEQGTFTQLAADPDSHFSELYRGKKS